MCLGPGWRLGLRDVGTEKRWHDEEEHSQRKGRAKTHRNSLKGLGERRGERRGKRQKEKSKTTKIITSFVNQGKTNQRWQMRQRLGWMKMRE